MRTLVQSAKRIIKKAAAVHCQLDAGEWTAGWSTSERKDVPIFWMPLGGRKSKKKAGSNEQRYSTEKIEKTR